MKYMKKIMGFLTASLLCLCGSVASVTASAVDYDTNGDNKVNSNDTLFF